MATNTPRPTQSPKAIALKGSAATVADYFRYAVYSILFLRGVYAIEDFHIVNKYDLELLVAINEELEAYVAGVLDQVEQWLIKGAISQLVLVILSKEEKTALERWVFEISASQTEPDAPSKPDADIQKEIHLMLAGIRGTISMLSEIEEPTLCNILVYLKEDEPSSGGPSEPPPLPDSWEDAVTYAIDEDFVNEVKLKNFATDTHRVEATVVYRE